MTNPEFNNEFEILYNSITSNQAPGLSEYEKSVFLTQALEEIVLAAYSGVLNGEAFEAAEEIRTLIQELVKSVTTLTKIEDEDLLDSSSVVFLLPDDVWYPVYELARLRDDRLNCKDGSRVVVKPTTHDHFDKIKDNPFKGSNDRRVLRISLGNKKVELFSEYNIESYLIRYLKRPQPIIIEDLSGYGLSINGVTDLTECQLNSATHRLILKRAVDIARSVWN